MRKKKISVRDLAEECGVAIGTVSRVINNKPGVREDLREKVLQAVKRHNYNPFAHVPIVSKVLARTIKVVMPYYDTPSIFMDGFYSRGVEGIKQAVVEKGYEMMIVGEQSFSEQSITNKEETAITPTAAGVVFLCPQRNWNEMIGTARRWNIPTALVNRETNRKGVISVREKDRRGAFAAMVKHLASLGHRTVYCITPIQGRIIHNMENFKFAVREAGLVYDESHFMEYTLNRDRLEELHVQKKMPDAFFCIGDMNAIGVMKNLQRLGYRVPEDVAVAGYNNISMCRYTTPELTTVDNHIDKMAGLATKMLIERIEGSGYTEMDIEIEADLVVRESCGAGVRSDTDTRSVPAAD